MDPIILTLKINHHSVTMKENSYRTCQFKPTGSLSCWKTGKELIRAIVCSGRREKELKESGILCLWGFGTQFEYVDGLKCILFDFSLCVRFLRSPFLPVERKERNLLPKTNVDFIPAGL